MREKKTEYQVVLGGEPEEVRAMLKVAAQVEPAIFKKQWLNDGHLVLFYRADEPRTDLLEALKRAAGQPVVEMVFDDDLLNFDENDEEQD